MSEQPYRYWAFISYSHHDVRAAVQLHRWLERYVVPRRLVGRASPDGPLPRRLFPIFRDRDELPSSAELGGVIHRALSASRYLIVVCSPRSATSRWVNEEIRQFKAMGCGERILALIVDGEPDAQDPARECFPRALRFDVDAAGVESPSPTEPIAADLRRDGDGDALARAKLLSGLLNVGLDELLRRERRRRLQRRLVWTAGIAATLALGLALLGWQQREYRTREHAALIARLLENGRQELLAGSQMRAAVFLAEAYRLGVDTPALRFMLRQAMQPIDALTQVIDTGAPLVAMRLSADDRTLVTYSGNGKVRAWALDSGLKLAEFDGFDLSASQSYCGPALSRDGRRVAIADVAAQSEHGVLKVWSLPDATLLLQTPIAARNCGMSQPFNADGSQVVAIATDGRPRLWPLDGGAAWSPPDIEAGAATIATFSADGRWLAAGRRDGGVWAWPFGAQAPALRLPPLAQAVTTMEFAPAGDLLVAAADDGAMRGWTLPDGRVAFAGGHGKSFNRLQFAAAAPRLLTGGVDGERVWRSDNGALLYAGAANNLLRTALRADGEQLCRVEWRQALITDVQSTRTLFKLEIDTRAALFTGDGRRLLSADPGGRVMVWNERFRPLASGQHGARAGEAPMWWRATVDFAMLADGLVVSGGQDGRMRLWQGRELAPAGSLDGFGSAITRVVATPDGRRVAAATVAGDIAVWAPGDAAPLRRITLPGRFVSTLAISPDGLHLFAADRADRGHLWRIDDGAELAEYAMDTRFSVDFSPDSKLLALGRGRRVETITLATLGTELSEPLAPDAPPVGCVKFAPDSAALLAMADGGSGVARWISLRDGSRRQTVVAGEGCFYAQFSPDGGRVLLQPGAASVSIWDPADGRVLRLGEHAGLVYDARWSPDGRFIVSAGTDGLAKVSDSVSGLPLQNLAIHAGLLSAAAYSQDGNTVYSAASDGRVQSWDAALETRPARDIASRLDCVSPWKLEGTMLLSRNVDMARCAYTPDAPPPASTAVIGPASAQAR